MDSDWLTVSSIITSYSIDSCGFIFLIFSCAGVMSKETSGAASGSATADQIWYVTAGVLSLYPILATSVILHSEIHAWVILYVNCFAFMSCLRMIADAMHP